MAVIPIPLSPDKEAAGELHRTRKLSRELGQLLGVPVRNYLALSEPVSKRRMISAGSSINAFKRRYYNALVVDPGVAKLHSAMLVDDAITHGATIACATSALRKVNANADIVVASAAQMIVKDAVVTETDFVE